MAAKGLRLATLKDPCCLAHWLFVRLGGKTLAVCVSHGSWVQDRRRFQLGVQSQKSCFVVITGGIPRGHDALPYCRARCNSLSHRVPGLSAGDPGRLLSRGICVGNLHYRSAKSFLREWEVPSALRWRAPQRPCGGRSNFRQQLWRLPWIPDLWMDRPRRPEALLRCRCIGYTGSDFALGRSQLGSPCNKLKARRTSPRAATNCLMQASDTRGGRG